MSDWLGFSQKSLDIFYDRSTIPQGLTPGGNRTGLNSNVVMAPVMWIMRTFTEAVAVVESRRPNGVWEHVVDHQVEQLIDRPNAAYDGDALWKATAVSYVLAGNAYWRKVRNRFGEVVALWYLPHWLVKPIWSPDGSDFITYYDYVSGIGPPLQLAPRDLIHFRFGLDPENTRLGLSPLRALWREIGTDDEAAKFSEKILENMGVPGLMVSPKDNAKLPSPDEIEKLREYFRTAFSGDRRGAAMVMGMPTDVAQFGFDPNKLMLGSLRDISEERVCAALGLPSAVVGFGSGLQSTKVGATMRELRRLAWVQCLIPMQKSMAKQVTAQLLPEYVSQLRRFRVRFDTSDVASFQEEDALKAHRAAELVLAGIMRVDRAQAWLGLEVDTTRALYLGPPPAPAEAPAAPDSGGVAVPEEEDDESSDTDAQLMRAIRARVLSNGNGNGNGRGT